MWSRNLTWWKLADFYSNLFDVLSLILDSLIRGCYNEIKIKG